MAIAPIESVDTASSASISFAAPERAVAVHGDPSEGRLREGDSGWGGLSAGPIRTGRAVQGFPIQQAKVQRPPLRAATLHRERLIRWLDEHVTHRLILVTAEAGYGKTTLLADWSRRVPMPIAWYRIEQDDANWASFLRYLIAAGREI